MSRPVLAVLATTVALFALAGCSPPSINLEEQQTFNDQTRTYTVEAGVSEEVEDLSLELTLEVDQGTVGYRVVDPLGQVRWEGEIGAGGDLSDGRTYPTPEVGGWRLEISLRGASGKYRAHWIGR